MDTSIFNVISGMLRLNISEYKFHLNDNIVIKLIKFFQNNLLSFNVFLIAWRISKM